ncbi:oligosaccharide flippase family protein [Peribacillus sp. SCS-37]|uniref:putative polysaccharide biosynthesis protein n=1 Tax=Paraperibacillus esterisolvens TaxID=3115296 RepID=UPI0039057C89
MAERPDDISSTVFRGAAILTAAAILVKVLSAFYRIPYQNLAGDIGFYIYQQVYPLYGIALILSTYGFPVIISKLMAEKQGNSKEAGEVLYVSFLILTAVGLAFFSAVYFGAGRLAAAMGDKQLAPLLKISAFPFLFMPFISAARGMFQAGNDMIPTAVSQVFEQAVRVSFIIIFTMVLLRGGGSIYKTGGGAVLGSVLGAAGSTLTLLTFLWIRKFQIPIRARLTPGMLKKTAGMLFIQGTAFCLSSLLLTLTQLADSFNLYSLLVDAGMAPADAKGLKGVFDRGQPLLQLGSIAATSLSMAVVPLISSSRAQDDMNYLKEKIRLSLKITITLGAGAAAGLILLIKPVNIMLFTDSSGSGALAILAATILPGSLIMILSVILQSLGRLRSTILIISAGLLTKLILNMVLVPPFKIEGAAMATLFAYAFILGGLLVVLSSKLKLKPGGTKELAAWVLGCLGMAAALLLHTLLFKELQLAETGRLATSLQALSGVGAGGIVYIWIIVRSGIFPENDLSQLPFGRRLTVLNHHINNKRSYGSDGE